MKIMKTMRKRRIEEADTQAERSIAFLDDGEDSFDDDDDDIYKSPETFATFQNDDDATATTTRRHL